MKDFLKGMNIGDLVDSAKQSEFSKKLTGSSFYKNLRENDFVEKLFSQDKDHIQDLDKVTAERDAHLDAIKAQDEKAGDDLAALAQQQSALVKEILANVKDQGGSMHDKLKDLGGDLTQSLKNAMASLGTIGDAADENSDGTVEHAKKAMKNSVEDLKALFERLRTPSK